MDLLLWRHAEAEDGIPDLKRRLTARGEKQAAQMGEWLKKNAPKNLLVVASPALRCQQTARALGDGHFEKRSPPARSSRLPTSPEPRAFVT